MLLRKDEVALTGQWIATPNGVVGDETCARIQALLRDTLVHIADHPDYGAWQSLFRDPNDGRLWERSYPEGHLHGGGPPALLCVTEAEAKSSYSC
jgi:Immunity protein 27